jgi:hypothetical protein
MNINRMRRSHFVSLTFGRALAGTARFFQQVA